MTFFIFGDSMALGLWDTKGGWADRLKSFVQKLEVANELRDYNKVYTLGVDGDTTTGLLARIEQEVRPRLWEGENYVFIFAIGINDTIKRKGKIPEISKDDFTKNLQKLTAIARKFTDKVIYLGLTPVNEELTNPLRQSKTGKCYTNQRIEAFNEIISDHCISNNINFIDLNEVFKKHNNYKKILIDGAHPDSRGHKLIYKAVISKIQKQLHL